jgi:hypothetical protein
VTLMLVHLVVPVPIVKTLLFLGIVGAGFAAMARWVAANRVAIDQVDWCACVPSTITVREIRGRSADHANGDRPGRPPGIADEPMQPLHRHAEPVAPLPVSRQELREHGRDAMTETDTFGT